MYERSKTTCVLLPQFKILRLHPLHVTQVKSVRTGKVRPDRRGTEVLHPLGQTRLQLPSSRPGGWLFAGRQVIKKVLHPLGQLRIRAAEQQPRWLERIAVVALSANEKIHLSIISPAPDQQLQQPGVTGETILVAPQTKRRANALRQKTVAMYRLRQHALVCAGDDQVRCILPRQLEPALQVDRVRRPLRE